MEQRITALEIQNAVINSQLTEVLIQLKSNTEEAKRLNGLLSTGKGALAAIIILVGAIWSMVTFFLKS